MQRFLIRRTFSVLLAMFGATVFIFALTRVGPDPRYLYIPDTGGIGIQEELWEKLGKELGIDKPLPVQYAIWLSRVVRGDFGESIGTLRPVSEIVREKVGATIQLAIGAWLFAILVGVPIGVLAAVKRASLWDYSGRTFALFGQALPQFWTGVIAILVFAVILGWFPSGTRPVYHGFPLAWENLKFYVLPCIVLGWPASAGIMRLTRSSMLEILDSEFIKLARAKGVGNTAVIWKHSLRNAVLPPLTSALVLLADYLNGALVIETVFSWPGIGQVALNRAVYQNDWPLLVGTVFMFMGIYVSFALLADLLYAFIDPRIRYS
jgi:peptide/nickel transport system permease protein